MDTLASILRKVPISYLRAELKNRYTYIEKKAEKIHIAACLHFQECPDKIQHARRCSKRMLIIHLMATQYRIRHYSIRSFYGIDWGTVTNAINRTTTRLEKNPQTAQKYAALEKTLRAELQD